MKKKNQAVQISKEDTSGNKRTLIARTTYRAYFNEGENVKSSYQKHKIDFTENNPL